MLTYWKRDREVMYLRTLTTCYINAMLKEELEHALNTYATNLEVAKHLGIFERTLYRRKKEFGLLQPRNPRTCLQCGSKRPRHNKNYCSHSCHIKHNNAKTIASWLAGEIQIHGEHSAFVPSAVLRKYCYSLTDYKCSECGFSGYNRKTGNTILQLHHVDGDASNGAFENIQVLCPNCHAMTESFMAANKGNSTRAKRYGK